MRRAQPEHELQSMLMQWAEAAKGGLPWLGLLYAIPNGGSRNPREAKRLKAEGVKAGVPDLHLPVPHRGHAGLWLETKVERIAVRNGKPTKTRTYQTPEQRVWADALRSLGHKVVVYRTLDEGRDAILDYLEGL